MADPWLGNQGILSGSTYRHPHPRKMPRGDGHRCPTERASRILGSRGIPALWNVTHIEPSEEILDGLFRDIVGQVSQECRVRGGFGKAASVNVGLACGARGRGKDGAVDRRRPVNVVVIAVPRGGDCGEIRDVGTDPPAGASWGHPELAWSTGVSKSPQNPPRRGSRKQPEAAGRNWSHPEPTGGNWSQAEQWQLLAALENPWKRCPEAIQSCRGRDRQSHGMAFQDSFPLGFQPGSVGSSGESAPQTLFTPFLLSHFAGHRVSSLRKTRVALPPSLLPKKGITSGFFQLWVPLAARNANPGAGNANLEGRNYGPGAGNADPEPGMTVWELGMPSVVQECPSGSWECQSQSSEWCPGIENAVPALGMLLQGLGMPIPELEMVLWGLEMLISELGML